MKTPGLITPALMLVIAGSLASVPALAKNDKDKDKGDEISEGPVANLPGPGVLGLVIAGLAAGVLVARRRK